MLSDQDIASIRGRFRIFRRKVYLNSCSQGALSDAVEEGLAENLATWHEQGSPWDVWIEKYEEARAQFAAFIGAHPDEVAVVASASAGINSVASALDFRERNKVVLGEFEFPTMGHVWLAQQKRGAQLEFVLAQGERIDAAAYSRAIDDRTAIVPVTQVCFMNGFRSDIEAIIRIAHDRGALAMVDGYQDCGTRPIDVKALDVDFYVSGTLKYLLGPSGLAFLYVRRELIEKLQPTISGWFAQRNPFAFEVRRLDPAPTARRFEAGTPPIPSIYPAYAGIELLRGIGLENIERHVRRLAQALIEGASALGIQVKTPPDSSGPLVVLRSRDVQAMIARMAEHGIVVSGRHDGLRISFHVYNELEDARAALGVLERNLDLMAVDRVRV